MTKIVRSIAVTALLIIATATVTAQQISNQFAQYINKSLDQHKVSADALSLVAIPLTSQDKPTYLNADVSINPASTMKLFTTYAALELLGPNYRWRTAFYTDGEVKNGVLKGNLYLKGGGDPKLNMERLWLLLRDLRNNGVKTIDGNLILDQSYFKIATGSDSFEDDSQESYRPYLVSPNALLINFKVLRIIIREEDKKVQIITEPPLKDLKITDNIEVIKPKRKNKCPAVPDIKYNPQTQANGLVNLTISGFLVENCSVQTYLSLFDHEHYSAGIVRTIWSELGGKITGKSLQGTVPNDATLLAESYSPDLVEVVRDINKFSNNTMAKQLFLSIGRKYRNANDTDDAAAAYRAIYNWLISKGVNLSELKIENGSGLSRNERITAREMSDLLRLAWQSPYAAEFISSMPIIGTDGTMHKRLRKTDAKTNGHIKTGTLKNVRATAGYVRDSKGNIWAVVAILNHPKPWGATDVLDDILLYIHNPTLTEPLKNK